MTCPYFKNYFNCNKNTVIIENVPSESSNEILLGNKIEEDLQAVLRPLNLMQSLFLRAKYSVRDNIITSNTHVYNFIGVLCILIFKYFYLYDLATFIIQNNPEWGQPSLLYCFSGVFDFVILLIGHSINNISNIMHSHFNMLIVLKIQYVIRVLKINGDELKGSIICNWTWVIILNIFFILTTFCFCISGTEFKIVQVITAYVNIIGFDMNIVYALLVLKLISKVLHVWVEKVRDTEYPEGEEYWNIMFNAYRNIQETFMIIETTFRQMIVFYIIAVAYMNLRGLNSILTYKDLIATGEMRIIILLLLNQVWNVKNFFILICLSVECERFYAAMRDVQSTCVMLMNSSNCSDPGRRVCKNIQRVQKASFQKMSACCLFIIDAELPVEFLSFIVCYAIVILEFTYL